MKLFNNKTKNKTVEALTQTQDSSKTVEAENVNEVHVSSPAETVFGGLGWYRTQFRRAMKLALGLVVTQGISLAVIALLLMNQPGPRYFAATPDLRLAPLIPLDQPVLTQEGLLTWASDTITGAMSLNFLEWREKLESLRGNFDDDAYKSFLSSLKDSGILDMIREKRLSASAITTRAPVIIASGLVGGTATWRIEFPLIVSYESSQGVESTQRLVGTVLVRRASTVKTPRGVAIQQIVLKRDS